VAVVIGVDIGQRHDPTAICVVETDTRPFATQSEVHFRVRYLERLPLGTPYPQVADRIGEIAAGARERGLDIPQLFVDATGVGQPVLDLLNSRSDGVFVVGVYFTHGDRRTQDSHLEVKLGKAFLVSRLQTLLQSGRLHLPLISEAEVLARELLDYEIRVDQNANDRYGAFKVGTHDDLVTALGLAVQTDCEPGFRVSELRL